MSPAQRGAALWSPLHTTNGHAHSPTGGHAHSPHSPTGRPLQSTSPHAVQGKPGFLIQEKVKFRRIRITLMRIRIQLFNLMRIRIQLLFKKMGIYDHWSIDPRQDSILSLQTSIL